jgi:excisionase family DNA binding protein
MQCEYLTPREAASYLRISISTLAKLRVYGGGPVYIRLGRAIRYTTHDLDDWATANRRSSTSENTRRSGANP